MAIVRISSTKRRIVKKRLETSLSKDHLVEIMGTAPH